MKTATAHWILALGLGLALMPSTQAQEKNAASPAVQGIKGVKEEAVADVKNIQTGNAASSGGVVNPGTASNAQGVNKVNGVETINGVKSDGRNAVLPTPPPPPVGAPPPPPPPIVSAGGTDVPAAETAPPPPPPPPVVSAGGTMEPSAANTPPPPPPPIVAAGGTTVPAGGGSVGTAANIRAVQGVGGINTAKLQNLEAALQLKKDGTGTPTGSGAEKGGKGRAAAAGLLSAPLEKQPGPKLDGRAGFQEFEKLQNTGS